MLRVDLAPEALRLPPTALSSLPI